MSYTEAKAIYRSYGIDTEEALLRAAEKPISIHCWQGDDVAGFDSLHGGAGNGLAVTGNYPGRARNFAELKQDFQKAASLIPGKKMINLHASYAVFTEKNVWVDRNRLTYSHFEPWVEFAKENGLGIDFNPTVFSHPMIKNGLSLSSPDEKVRRFWIDHCIACRQIAQKIGEALNDQVLCNIWIPDGYKDTPADRISPRGRLKNALDEIFSEKYSHVIDSVESKFFAVGVESYTVGSSEFYTAYAASRKNVYSLMDAGHYHPSEYVSDKISSLLLYFQYVPIHVTRGVNWDSDHVVSFDDETKEICREIVRNDALNRVLVGLDFFDASINRIAAWVIGSRNFEKALLFALLQPDRELKAMEADGDFTGRLMLQEEAKTLPFSDVWIEYCRRQKVPAGREWFDEIVQYEKNELKRRSE